MATSREALDTFGKFLMEHLRDEAIEHHDFLAVGHYKGRNAPQTDLKMLDDGQRALVRRCIVDCVDHALHSFLFKLQEIADFENNIQLLVSNENVVGLSDGLHGELFGEDGWRAKYSMYGEPPGES